MGFESKRKLDLDFQNPKVSFSSVTYFSRILFSQQDFSLIPVDVKGANLFAVRLVYFYNQIRFNCWVQFVSSHFFILLFPDANQFPFSLVNCAIPISPVSHFNIPQEESHIFYINLISSFIQKKQAFIYVIFSSFGFLFISFLTFIQIMWK